MWEELARINEQLRWLAPVILTGERELLAPVAGNDVQVGRWQYQGGTYVVAINTSASGVVAEMALPEVQASRLRVLFERRQVSINNGKFQDGFGPHQVHIYAAM